MKHTPENLQLIPPDTPYSIIIWETLTPPYRVEGLASNADDIDIFEYGTLAECITFFEQLKSVFIEQGHYVQEVGCSVSQTQVPRHMLVNYEPYDVWKILYRNFNEQAQVNFTDKFLTAVRQQFSAHLIEW